MKRLAVTVLVLAAATPAAADVRIPRLTGPVVDDVGLLNASSRQLMDASLRRYQQQTSTQFQVLILNTLGGVPIEEYSIRVVEQWMLGTADKDNGVLLLLAMQDHKWRIEVGGGLEGELTDVQASRIGRGILTPHFKRGEYALGIAITLQAVASALGGELSFEGLATTRAPPRRRRFGLGSVVFLFIFLMLVFGGRGRGRGRVLLGGLLLGSMLGGGFRGGGRARGWGGGGGSWGGGGGGFSGGGASGGW